MKDGDTVTEKELETEGWTYEYHLSGGTYAYSKENKVMFYHRNSGEIVSIKEKVRFSPP